MRSLLFLWLLGIAAILLDVDAAIVSRTTSAKCTEITVSVSATAVNQNFIFTPQQFDSALASNFAAGVASFSTGTQTRSGSHNIRGTYCEPSTGSKSKTLQLLSHGVMYNRTYWKWPQSPQIYSWTDYMVSKGYATFAIDRLGNGESDHPDPVQVVQVFYEAQLYANLAEMIKAGKVPGVPNKFKKVVYVGHSAGSIIGNSLAVQRPTSVDGLLLTGYLNNYPYLAFTFPITAHLVPSTVAIPPYGFNPASFGASGPFYITSLDATGTTALYGRPGQYDPAVLAYDSSIRGILTAGEALTINGGDRPATKFTGPVRIQVGQYDLPFCDARAKDVNLIKLQTCSFPLDAGQQSAPYFPASKSFSYKVFPNTGHSLNLHYSAQDVFADAVNWLQSQKF